jgi:hypothetical protein
MNLENLSKAALRFCRDIELGFIALEDPRLDGREETVASLQEYSKYLATIGSSKLIWYNQAKGLDGFSKIYFEV